MSKEFRIYTGVIGESRTSSAMRAFCSRPGRSDNEGKPLYFTEQGHKRECDVNLIIKKYDKTGLISHVNKFEANFGDLTGMDFKEANDLVINANNQFNNLPSHIRKRFNNSPEEFLRFFESDTNREEAIKLGLIPPDIAAELDGLGEHVKAPPDTE